MSRTQRNCTFMNSASGWGGGYSICTVCVGGWGHGGGDGVWFVYDVPLQLGYHHGRRNFKDTSPYCRLYWSFLFGVVKQFCRFWIWSVTECKILAEYGLQHNSTLSTPPPPQPQFVCIYCTFNLGRGGSNKGRGATVHKYSSFVQGGNSSQAGSKIPTMNEWCTVCPV